MTPTRKIVRMSVRPSVDTLGGCLYALVLSNYKVDLNILVHRERAYVGAVPRRVIFDFTQKLPKLSDFELRQFFTFQCS